MLTQGSNSEANSPWAPRWKYIRRACLFGPPLITVAFYSYYWNDLVDFRGEAFVFSLSLCAVAAILAGTYFFTYKSFNENPFYYFIFASWVANAFYLIPERTGPTSCYGSYFYYRLGVLFLTLVSTLLLLLALFTPGKNKPAKPNWIIVGLVIGAAGTLITSYNINALPSREEILSKLQPFQMTHICAESYAAERGVVATGSESSFAGDGNTREEYKEYTRTHLFAKNEHKRLAWWVLGPSIISFATLWAMGIVLIVRLGSEQGSEPLGWKGGILQVTFFIYATLQFFYPFLPYYGTAGAPWGSALFFIAQMAKVGNAIAMLGVLQSAITYKVSKRDQEIRVAREEIAVKQAQLEVEVMKNQRKSQLEELGALAASIKHDINTPMATMGTHIDRMKRAFQGNQDLIPTLAKLEDSLDRIWATVKIVDFVRGDSEFYDREQFMRKVSMLEVVHRAVRAVKNEKPQLKANDSKDFIKVEGRDVWVRAHLPMLEQVVVNVVKNALEAIEEAGRERGLIKINVGTTEITDSKYARWVKVEVEDNGCGIREEHIKKLTTLFTTRSHKKPNSGIGLFIGKKILDIHGGKIKFESAVGEWAKVILLLPEWSALQMTESRTENAAPEAAEEWSAGGSPDEGTGNGTPSERAAKPFEISGGNV